MRNSWADSMILIFFVYGMSFFIMGIAIELYPKKGSHLRLVDNLWLISLFGFLHGINEWIDMFLLFEPSTIVKSIRFLLLPISFLPLIQFALNTTVEFKRKNPALKAIGIILLIFWVLIVALGKQKLLLGDIFARYLLCFPGAALTAYAITLYFPEIRNVKQQKIVTSSKFAVVAFSFYAIFAGMIVPEAPFFPASILNYSAFLDGVGVPVQIFRATCAVVITFALVRVLSVFEYEKLALLEKAQVELQERLKLRKNTEL